MLKVFASTVGGAWGLLISQWIMWFLWFEGVEALRITWFRPVRNAIITRNICCPWSGKNISIHTGHRGFRESKKHGKIGVIIQVDRLKVEGRKAEG